MKSRLAAVMIFVIFLPVISFATLGVSPLPPSVIRASFVFYQFGLFDKTSAAAKFVTPKFFVQTLFFSFLFVSAVGSAHWLCRKHHLTPAVSDSVADVLWITAE
jgi:hypothetical protein